MVHGRRSRLLAPWLLGAALAAAWLAADPPSDDLASAVYRSDLFAAHGWLTWDPGWYGGHNLLAYSVLFPPLGALLGPRLLGALATVAAVVLFERLVTGAYGRRAWPAALWFAVAAAANLAAGRIPFAVGTAFGLGALLALQRRRPAAAAALAIATGLASPVAGLFLPLAAAAWGAVTPAARRRAAAIVLAAILPPAALAIAFPEGGTMPFVLSSYLPCVGVAVLALALLPREQPALRLGAVLYALLATGAYLIDSPLGGNAARLGMLFGGPAIAAAVLGTRPRVTRRRIALLAAAALPLLYWPLAPVIRQYRDGADPSARASYYRPLLGFLAQMEREGRGAGKEDDRPPTIEIPPTRFHWEAAYVPARFPIARGWERQLDIQRAHVFYTGELDEAAYGRWLRERGARFVALPTAAAPDYAARGERALLSQAPGYLAPVATLPGWKVWRVRR